MAVKEGSTTIPSGSTGEVLGKYSLWRNPENDIVCASMKVEGSPGLTIRISRYEVTNRSEHKTRQGYDTKINSKKL